MNQFVLSNLKVLDVSTVIAGPAAALMLADFGADVIKIEEPTDGDMLRKLTSLPPYPQSDVNYLWQMDGRNKRSLTLNLKVEAGLSVLHKLIDSCDVLVINQPFPMREALGLTYDELKLRNSRMIYASLSAYGEQGPHRNRKAFDQVAYWGRSGLMDLMHSPDAKPVQGLPGMGDHPTAVSLYAGIVTALLQREKTGEGGMVHTSLLANGLWSVAAIAQGAIAGADMPGYRETNRFYGALSRPYQAKDGRWLQFNMVRTEEAMDRLYTAMDILPLLIDERFATPDLQWQNRQLLGDELQKVVASKTTSEWLTIFDAHSLLVNRIGLVEELSEDVQVLENSIAVKPSTKDFDMPLLIKHPIQLSNAPQVAPSRAPELGEHSEEILKELNFNDEEIAAMKKDGVI